MTDTLQNSLQFQGQVPFSLDPNDLMYPVQEVCKPTISDAHFASVATSARERPAAAAAPATCLSQRERIYRTNLVKEKH